MDYQLNPSLGPDKYAQQNGAVTLESEFVAPYLAHAPMEPLNCTIFERDGLIHVHTGTHYQFADKAAIVKTLGVDASLVNYTLPWEEALAGEPAQNQIGLWRRLRSSNTPRLREKTPLS